MKDGMRLKGKAIIERRLKNGKVVDREIVNNLIVNTGLERVARMICGDGSGIGAFGYIAIGEGTNAPTASDTTLQTERVRENSTDVYEASYKATFEHTFTFGSGVSYSITEIGIFDEASGGTMFDRFTFGAKEVDAEILLYVKITITVN